MNKINPLRTFFASLVFICICFLIFGISYLLKGILIINILGVIALAFLVILIVANIIIMSLRTKKNSKEERIEQMLETVTKYQKEAKDFLFVYNKTLKKIRISNFLISLIYISLITLEIAVVSNILTKFNGILIAFIIIIALTIFEITLGLFCVRTKFTPKLDERNKYPYISSILNKCKENLGINSEVRLYFTFSDDVFVEKTDKNNQIAIGVGVLNVLKEEELENVIYHELAHINNNDTIYSSKIVKMSAPYYNFQNPIFVSLGLSLLLTSVVNNLACEETELFLHFSKFEKEKQADKLVFEKGDKEAYINALAKTSLIKFQTDHRFTFNTYENEEPIKNYVEWFIEKRINNYLENKEQYTLFLNKALPLRFDTHPSFAMRMESFEINKFDIDFAFERSEEYQKEIALVNKKFNEEWYNVEKVNWKEKREQNYLFYVNEFERINKQDVESLTIEDLMKLAFCYRVFKDLPKALETCNKILSIQPDNVFALQHRAYTKYALNDLSCVEDFERASELEHSLLEENDFYIGMVYNNNGLEEELEEYRKNTIVKIKQATKNQIYLNKKKDKAFVKHDLNDQTLGTIKQELLKYSQIKKAYIVKQYINENTYRYLVGLIIDKKTKENDIANILSDLYVFFETFEGYRFSVGNITYDPYFKGLVGRKRIKDELK